MCSSEHVQKSSVVNDAAFDLSSKTSSWKNMPMMAIMASLPLASSADSFLVFSAGIRRSQDLPSEVTRSCSSASRLVLGDLAEGHVRQDLSPSRSRHLGDCCQAVGHIPRTSIQQMGKGSQGTFPVISGVI